MIRGLLALLLAALLALGWSLWRAEVHKGTAKQATARAVAEHIMRGAIESIDPGQMEAAKSIGMTYRQAMRRIIIPQTYKRLVPPVGNEFIALIKDTALVSTIAMVELMRTADQIFNATFNIFILGQAAIIYLLMTSLFTLAFHKLEERLGVYENR